MSPRRQDIVVAAVMLVLSVVLLFATGRLVVFIHNDWWPIIKLERAARLQFPYEIDVTRGTGANAETYVVFANSVRFKVVAEERICSFSKQAVRMSLAGARMIDERNKKLVSLAPNGGVYSYFMCTVNTEGIAMSGLFTLEGSAIKIKVQDNRSGKILTDNPKLFSAINPNLSEEINFLEVDPSILDDR